jgi:hypothetical protein
MCPVCRGKMELVYDRPTTNVFICTDCHSGVTVPASAWVLARRRGLLAGEEPS